MKLSDDTKNFEILQAHMNTATSVLEINEEESQNLYHNKKNYKEFQCIEISDNKYTTKNGVERDFGTQLKLYTMNENEPNSARVSIKRYGTMDNGNRYHQIHVRLKNPKAIRKVAEELLNMVDEIEKNQSSDIH